MRIRLFFLTAAVAVFTASAAYAEVLGDVTGSLYKRYGRI